MDWMEWLRDRVGWLLLCGGFLAVNLVFVWSIWRRRDALSPTFRVVATVMSLSLMALSVAAIGFIVMLGYNS